MSGAPAPFSPHGASAAELKAQLEAERQGQPFLVLRDGDGVQRIVVLAPEATSLTVGRAPERTSACRGTRRSPACTPS